MNRMLLYIRAKSRMPVDIMFGRPPEAEGMICSITSAYNTVDIMSCKLSYVRRLL